MEEKNPEKYTYFVGIDKKPGSVIGWRKTLKQALDFAEELMVNSNYDSITITRKERKESDFDY